MKKLLAIGLLLVSYMSMSEIFYDDKHFFACSSCVTDGDFLDAARNRFLDDEETAEPGHFFASKDYVVSNKDLGFRSVRVMNAPFLTMPYAQLQSDTEQLSTVFTQFKLNKRNFSVNTKFTSSPHVSPVWNRMFIGRLNDIPWANNVRFAKDYRESINQLLTATGDYNPFHFIDTPLVVDIVTADDYIITLVSKKPQADKQWEIVVVNKGDDYIVVGQASSTQTTSCINCLAENTGELYMNGIALSALPHHCYADAWSQICRNTLLGIIFVGGVSVYKADVIKGEALPPPKGCPRGNNQQMCSPK